MAKPASSFAEGGRCRVIALPCYDPRRKRAAARLLRAKYDSDSYFLRRGDKSVLTRTTVTIPEELMVEVDRLAGRRGRSAFVAAAIEEAVKR